MRCQSIDLFPYLFENMEVHRLKSLISSDEYVNDYSMIQLPTLSPTEYEKKVISELPTCSDLVEAIATWKQFNWLSLIWYGGQSPHSQTLEKEWLSWLGKNNPKYLKTANYIAERSSITLKNSMFGIIIDLALNPPIFSQGISCWTEVLPQLRLNAILNIIDKLFSEEDIKKDYLELISPKEYEAIIDKIENKLGWHKSKEIVHDTLKSISKSLDKLKEYNYKSKIEKEIHSRLINAYLLQFNHGLINNIMYPSYMLFPWNNPHSSMLGSLLRPIATQYSDRLVINIMRLEDLPNQSFVYDPTGLWIILKDMAESIWLFENINQNLKQTRKFFARKFYNGIPDALRNHFNYSTKVKKEVKLLLRKWDSFDEFISHRIENKS